MKTALTTVQDKLNFEYGGELPCYAVETRQLNVDNQAMNRVRCVEDTIFISDRTLHHFRENGKAI